MLFRSGRRGHRLQVGAKLRSGVVVSSKSLRFKGSTYESRVRGRRGHRLQVGDRVRSRVVVVAIDRVERRADCRTDGWIDSGAN